MVSQPLNDEDIFGSSTSPPVRRNSTSIDTRRACTQPGRVHASEKSRHVDEYVLGSNLGKQRMSSLSIFDCPKSTVQNKNMCTSAIRANDSRSDKAKSQRMSNPLHKRKRVSAIPDTSNELRLRQDSSSKGKDKSPILRNVRDTKTSREACAKNYNDLPPNTLPRTAKLVPSEFDEPPWRRDYDPVTTVPPLTELCYRRAVANSHRFGDMGDIPDNFLYPLLKHATPETLDSFEECNPSKAKVSNLHSTAAQVPNFSL